MTREEAKQLLPIIKAFSEGKVIEIRTKPSVLNNPAIPNEWTEMKELEYWGNTEYRIKPEPKYRPFQSAEECWQEMQKHQPFGWMKSYDGSRYYLIDNIDNNMKFAAFVKGLIFADDQPFGIKEDEESV